MKGRIRQTHSLLIFIIINFSLLLMILMAISALKAAAAVPSPPLAGGKGSNNRSPDGILLAQKDFQARVRIEQPKLIGGVSRRDAISLASATLLSNLIASDAAEARRIKPETRKKIREKLDKLREKGGITKEKTGSNAGDKEPEPFSPLNSLSIPLVEAAV